MVEIALIAVAVLVVLLTLGCHYPTVSAAA